MTSSLTLVEVIGHCDYQESIDVCCQFDNGDKNWTPVKEILRDGNKDDRLILEKYAMKEELCKGQVWSRIHRFGLIQLRLCCVGKINKTKSIYFGNIFSICTRKMPKNVDQMTRRLSFWEGHT